MNRCAERNEKLGSALEIMGHKLVVHILCFLCGCLLLMQFYDLQGTTMIISSGCVLHVGSFSYALCDTLILLTFLDVIMIV